MGKITKFDHRGKTLTAKKAANGQVFANVTGEWADVYEMLIAINRSVASILLQNSNTPEVTAQSVIGAANVGVQMAIDDAGRTE